VAPLIDGNGEISALGGSPVGADGAVRFEANLSQFGGIVKTSRYYKGKPFGLFLPPSSGPNIRVESMNDVPVGLINLSSAQPSSVKIGLVANTVPAGTTVDLQCFSPGSTGRLIRTSPLVGTDQESRTSARVLMPAGKSLCLVIGDSHSDG